MRLRSWTLQEPEIERREDQDNSDVYYQPLPELVPEEQDVHADHDGYQREHVKHDGCLSSHRYSPLYAQADFVHHRRAARLTARRPRGAAAVVLVKMHVRMRLSCHATNEMRLYGITLDDVESAAGDPVTRDVDDRGNTRLTGQTVDGRLILVVVAGDDPDFVITVFLRS